MILEVLCSKAYAVETGVAIGGKTSFKDYNSYIKAIFNWGLKLGFALCVLMFIYAGVKYIISQGNQTALNDAKDLMTNTVIGFVMLVLVYVIMKILGVG